MMVHAVIAGTSQFRHGVLTCGKPPQIEEGLALEDMTGLVPLAGSNDAAGLGDLGLELSRPDFVRPPELG